MTLDLRIRSSAGTSFLEPRASGAAPVVVGGASGASHFTYAGMTGVIGAALASNSSVFAMRLSPTAGSIKAFVHKVRLLYVTTVAYTTPITAGRRLCLWRGSGAAASSGTGVVTGTVAQKDTNFAGGNGQCDVSAGGDIRIATTGALTTTGITFETEPLAALLLAQAGNAGNFVERIYEYSPISGYPVILNAGQLLAVRTPNAFDAAGTWQLAVEVEWQESASDIGT